MSFTNFQGKQYELTPAHPEADRYPWLPDEQLQELANDIGANGQREPIRKLRDGRILDGRNRELACLIAGVEPIYLTVDVEEEEVAGFVLSLNYHRRHLTPEQKWAAIASKLRADPAQSNRSIAAALGASHHTVEAVRSDLESTGQIAQLEARKGRDGKTRTAKPVQAREPKPDQAAPDEPAAEVAETPPHPFAELMREVTALARKVTEAMKSDDPRSARLQKYLTYAGLVDHKPGKTENGETIEATLSFLPLRGVRKLIELAGEDGPEQSSQTIRQVYALRNGEWIPPLTAKRRKQKSRQ